jgi:hypothetical protein
LDSQDIINGDNLENKIFKGDGPVNFNVDAEFYGPELLQNY